MKREELEQNLNLPEKEILAVIDSVCKGAFISNRDREKLVRKLDLFVTDKVYTAVTLDKQNG